MSHYVPGMGVGKHGVEAAKLALQLGILCQVHHVNTIHDLPPESFQQAMAMQSKIDSLRREQAVVLGERGRRGLVKAHAQAATRRAARLNEFRKAVAARGGLAAVNKVRLARELGMSRGTVQKYAQILSAEEAAGPPRCAACHQLLPEPETLSVEADIAATARQRNEP